MDRDSSGSSPLTELAASLLTSDAAREEFQSTLQSLGGTSTSREAERGAQAGIAAGLTETERTRRSRADQPRTPEQTITVTVREIENTAQETVGARVYVDLPPEKFDVYRGDHALLVKTPYGAVEEPIDFDPATVEEADFSNGRTSILVRPKGETDDRRPNLNPAPSDVVGDVGGGEQDDVDEADDVVDDLDDEPQADVEIELSDEDEE